MSERDIVRYGLKWNGPKDWICTPMDDGYWTPWHIAAADIARLRTRLASAEAERERLREKVLAAHRRVCSVATCELDGSELHAEAFALTPRPEADDEEA